MKLKELKNSRKLAIALKHPVVVIEVAEEIEVALVVVTDPEVIAVVAVAAVVIDLVNQDQKAKLVIDQEVIVVAAVAEIDPELLYQTLPMVKKLAQLLQLIVQNALKDVAEVEAIEVLTNSKVNLVKMLTH